MAGSISSLTYNTYLKENVWYAFYLKCVFDGPFDPSLVKTTPSVGDNVYEVKSTSSTSSTSSTFNGYDLWGTVLSISNNGNRVTCRRNSDNAEYTFVRTKYNGSLKAWYNSTYNRRIYTQTESPEPLEGFYDENGDIYTPWSIYINGYSNIQLSSYNNNVVTLYASDYDSYDEPGIEPDDPIGGEV